MLELVAPTVSELKEGWPSWLSDGNNEIESIDCSLTDSGVTGRSWLSFFTNLKVGVPSGVVNEGGNCLLTARDPETGGVIKFRSEGVISLITS